MGCEALFPGVLAFPRDRKLRSKRYCFHAPCGDEEESLADDDDADEGEESEEEASSEVLLLDWLEEGIIGGGGTWRWKDLARQAKEEGLPREAVDECLESPAGQLRFRPTKRGLQLW